MALTEYQVNAVGAFNGFAAPRFAAAAEWVPYDAANKPSFTAPGAYTVEYRSTDAAGNVEATKTVAFSIAAQTGRHARPGDDRDARPGAARARRDVLGAGHASTSRPSIPPPAGPPANNFDVDAAGTQWAPTTLSLIAGDSITWRFGPAAGTAHDVWVVPPGGDPSPTGPDLTKVSDVVFPGGAPVSRTFTQTGTWTFLCRLHATFTSGTWNGMTGTAAVTPVGSSRTRRRAWTSPSTGSRRAATG